jgi:hypothetical protein
MSNAIPSYRRRGPEDRRTTRSYDQSHAQRARHGINRRRSAWVIRHRTHPRPPAPHATTAITASDPQQTTTPVNTANINPHNSRKA